MDVVGKGDDVFIIAVVVLERGLNDGIPIGGGHMHHLIVENLISTGLVHELDEGRNSSFVAVLLRNRVLRIPGVGEGDLQPGVKKGLFPQPLLQHVEFVFGGFGEDRGIRLEPDQGAGRIGITDNGKIVHRHPPFEPLGIDVSFPGHLNFQPFGQGIDHRGTHAVQAA